MSNEVKVVLTIGKPGMRSGLPGPKKDLFSDVFSMWRECNRRSTPSKLITCPGSGTISSSMPSYYSVVDGGVHYAAIFQDPDHIWYYENGIETDNAFISMGDPFDRCNLYEEGCFHSPDFVIKDILNVADGCPQPTQAMSCLVPLNCNIVVDCLYQSDNPTIVRYDKLYCDQSIACESLLEN